MYYNIPVMTWVTFAYSFSKEQSTARVTLWRRLQRLGAVAPAGNLYLLPARPECVEAFQWLTQEVQAANGQAIMGHCDRLEGMSEAEIIAQFCAARREGYTVVIREAERLERQQLTGETATIDAFQAAVGKLRRQLAEVEQIDYFDCPERVMATNQLARLERRIANQFAEEPAVSLAQIAQFQRRTWVTRPQPFIDRLASIWLIRRFIDPRATIRYGPQAEDGEISFDMPDAQFGHLGNLCTFETLLRAFQLREEELFIIAEIVHQIDLNDGRYYHPEAVGVGAILKGWLAQGLTDQQLEENGVSLFDGLLAAIKN